MDRRIFGLETEFGVNATFRSGGRLSPEEVARYLFRKVVAWGRSSNVFLANGSRLYLDVGSHPEYATAECADLLDLVAHDRAGELVVQDLAEDAERRLAEEGMEASVYVLKNNVDSRGNSYGSHENYLIERTGRLERITDTLVPFLVTRQLVTGAGRLHVIVGDSTMSQTTTLLRAGTTDLVLRMLEAGTIVPPFALANPVQAIRDISRDPTGRVAVPLASGGTITALGMQSALLELARRHAQGAGIADQSPHREVLELWERGLHAVESDQLHLVDTEIEWVMKRRLLQEYADRHGLGLHDERLQQLDLVWHDVHPQRGLARMLERSGRARTVVSDEQIARAMVTPPETRARLRGEFVRAAQEHRRDFTVDWVHLKLNDAAQRTVVCKDPFAAVDARVDQLIEHIRTAGPPGTPRGV